MFELSFLLPEGGPSGLNVLTDERLMGLKEKSVLFIDDDYVNFLYYKEMISDIAPKIIRTISLQQAMQKLVCDADICLIVLSASLPDNHQNFALKYLKAQYPYIPVIILLSSHSRQSESEFLLAGADTCINHHTNHDHFTEILLETVDFSEYSNTYNH